MNVDRSPTAFGRRLALGAGALAVAVSALASPFALGVAALGWLALLVGLVRGSGASITAGLGWFLLAAVVEALGGVPVEGVLTGVVAGVVAWDAGRRAIDVGRQLGDVATTRPIEVVHAAATTAVATVSAGIGYLVYGAAGGGYPTATVAATLAAVLVLLALLASQ